MDHRSPGSAPQTLASIEHRSSPGPSVGSGMVKPRNIKPESSSKRLLEPTKITSSMRLNSRETSTGFHHTPVAATIVFGRDARPLHLPELDAYLASISAPPFQEEKEEDVIFPPMGSLAQTGRTIEDLELNNVKTPAWRNPKTILGSTVNIILGFMVRL